MIPWLRTLSKEFLQVVYFREGFMWRLPAGAQDTVGLTFDDGPDPTHTPAMLEVLARHRIKATFFVVGRNASLYPDLANEIAKQGHALGGHTYNHKVIIDLSQQELTEELESCRQAIQEAAGIDTFLFRPPKGQVTLSTIRTVIRLGYRVVHWTKTYSDYKLDGTKNLLARVRDNPVRSRDILLFHDTNQFTVEALSQAIPEWLSRGVRFQRL